MPSFPVMRAEPAKPVLLAGDAFARGRAQAAACPQAAEAVRAALAARLRDSAALLARHASYLERQWEETARLDPAGLEEMRGVAAGFDLAERDVFAFLFAGQLAGVDAGQECSAWAYGTRVGKNRDLRGPALPLQRVFLHRDPAWGGRRVLCVGSLGAPGAYSSGINSDGLALADTQVVTRDQGPGLLRYFLMGRLLADCEGVEAALDLLRALPHAGGGTLVLADATGRVATVELGHRALAIERSRPGPVARTNHFLAPVLRDSLAGPRGDDSTGRLATLTGWLAEQAAPPDEDAAAAIMAGHDAGGRTGLCRHGAGGGSATVSCHLYDCATRSLAFAHGQPCAADWARYGFDQS